MFQVQKKIRFLTSLTFCLIFVPDSLTINSSAAGLFRKNVWEGSPRFYPLVVKTDVLLLSARRHKPAGGCAKHASPPRLQELLQLSSKEEKKTLT